jgi:RNA polymerase sigma factor (sigma-70 family)
MLDVPPAPGDRKPEQSQPERVSRSSLGQGETELRELLERNFERILGLVARLIRPYRGQFEVDEMGQEVLIRLLDARGRGTHFENDAHVLRYAMQVARNLLIDECRRRAVRKHQPLEAEDEPEADTVPSPEAGPLEKLLAVETDKRVQEAFDRSLSTLPEERMQRAVLLHFKGGQSPEELADEIKLSRATVYNWLSRFRSALRRELLGETET